MHTKLALASACAATALLAFGPRSSGSTVLYNFDFETGTSAALGSGLFYNTVTSSNAPGWEKSGSGIFRGAESVQRAGLSGIGADNTVMRVNGGSWKADLSSDNIALGNFQITLRVDVFALNWDDLLSFASVSNPTANYGLRLQGGATANTGKVALSGFSPLLLSSEAIAANSDKDWHTYVITGTTSGADALINYNVDGVDVGTASAVGGATDTMTVLYLGNRHPNASNAAGRNVNAVFDDVTISVIPEPSALLLLGFGVVGMIRRRR